MKYYYIITNPGGFAVVKTVTFQNDAPFTSTRQRKTRPPNTAKPFHHPPGGEAHEETPREIHILDILSGQLQITVLTDHEEVQLVIGDDQAVRGVIFADWEDVPSVGGHSSRNGSQPVEFWLTIITASSADEIPRLPLTEV